VFSVKKKAEDEGDAGKKVKNSWEQLLDDSLVLLEFRERRSRMSHAEPAESAEKHNTHLDRAIHRF
jgi:hypothetical protein